MLPASPDRAAGVRTARFLICTLVLLAALGTSSTCPADMVAQEPETKQPPGNGQPIAIKVGLFILNLVSLDEVTETFTCTGYLTESWQDPRLAFTPGPGQPSTRYYTKSQIWFPLLQLDNSAAPRTLSSYLLVARADGTVNYVEKFVARLSSNMKLRAFPFDSQDLEVYIHPFTGQVNRIDLEVDPNMTGISNAAYTPLPLWQTSRITYRSVSGEMSGEQSTIEAASHVVFGIHVKRKSEYYTFRIFLPLALMVAVSWGVLWIPIDDLNSQLLISVTTVLTLVAFSVALSNILPPVAYVTFYDAFFLLSFLFILMTIGEALIVHGTHRTADHATAMRIRRVTRPLLPILFVLCSIVLAIRFVFL
jgi:hypothetical protein